MEIEVLCGLDEGIQPRCCVPGKTYIAASNGRKPYLCVSSLKHGHALVALDSGTIYDFSCFTSTLFRECVCKVVVERIAIGAVITVE